MNELPILFSAPMVRAILEGRKTQTRRIVKPQHFREDHGEDASGQCISAGWYPDLRLCPFGKPGDRLWVREAFRFPQSLDHLSPSEIGEKALAAGYPKPWCPTQFEADGLRRTPQEWRDFVTPPQANEAGRLRASMHMPRWASRITLEVTGVRVERVQDISGMNAVREGVSIPAHIPQDGADLDWARREYRRVWEQINGPDSWSDNPWVWVVKFKRVEVPA